MLRGDWCVEQALEGKVGAEERCAQVCIRVIAFVQSFPQDCRVLFPVKMFSKKNVEKDIFFPAKVSEEASGLLGQSVSDRLDRRGSGITGLLWVANLP